MNVALDVFIIAVYMYLLEIDPLCLIGRSDRRREEVAMDGNTETNRSSLTQWRRQGGARGGGGCPLNVEKDGPRNSSKFDEKIGRGVRIHLRCEKS